MKNEKEIVKLEMLEKLQTKIHGINKVLNEEIKTFNPTISDQISKTKTYQSLKRKEKQRIKLRNKRILISIGVIIPTTVISSLLILNLENSKNNKNAMSLLFKNLTLKSDVGFKNLKLELAKQINKLTKLVTRVNAGVIENIKTIIEKFIQAIENIDSKTNTKINNNSKRATSIINSTQKQKQSVVSLFRGLKRVLKTFIRKSNINQVDKDNLEGELKKLNLDSELKKR